MADESKPCKACGAGTQITTLDTFHGVEGPVTVTVHAMPARVCANGHKRFLYAEFVPHLMDLVADAGQVAPQPPAVKRGLFKKHYYCAECNAELPAAATGQSERTLEANFKKAAPFTATVRVALHKCPGCGHEQILSNDQVADSAFKAVAHGFRAADVHVEH